MNATIDEPGLPWHDLPEPRFYPATLGGRRTEAREEALVLFHGDDELGVGERAGLHALSNEIVQPADFLGKLPPPLRAQVYNARIAAARDREVLVVLEGGRFTGLMPGGRGVLTYRETCNLAHETVAAVVPGVTVDRFTAGADGLELRLVTDLVRPVTRRVGDALAAGVQVRQHYSGEQSVGLYTKRLICLNGMTSARADFSWANRRELSAPHQRQWLRDGVVAALGAYQGLVARAERMAAVTVDAPEEALAERAAAIGAPRALLPALRAAWREEEDATEWGIINSLTRLATHGGLPRSLGRRLQHAAGEWVQNFEIVDCRLPRPVAERCGAQNIREV